ncbi:MAG: toxin [Calditrichaeota bacterium]|nr:MAG: toxin [Calditrichota bacterium]
MTNEIEWLKENREICFEDILFYIEHDLIVDDISHPNKQKYKNQRMMVFDINGYIYLVPYLESNSELFLKTIIPSRKATKIYLERKNE